jgi:F0F1-type ATP synthase membrane subunit c/vacuolar-type H+-ATPase subunit K
MTTIFVVCFVAGLGLSVVSFVSGLHSVTLFDNIFHGVVHGHRMLHLPNAIRHAGVKKSRSSMINAAAITAFLTWFGGGGLLLERLTPFSLQLVVGGAVIIGLSGGALINSAINALARQESIAASLTMTGVIARVVVPIRAGDGTGEIVFTHAGTRRVSGARSDSGQALDKGSEVIVTRYERGIAYVATWNELTEE